jgi:hypothetical protein
MNARSLFAVALLLATTFSFQSAYAGEALGDGFLGTFPFYHGDYPHYDGGYPPNPLIAPYGFYGCRSGCCRQPVWSSRHWHNVTTCHYPSRYAVRPPLLK